MDTNPATLYSWPAGTGPGPGPAGPALPETGSGRQRAGSGLTRRGPEGARIRREAASLRSGRKEGYSGTASDPGPRAPRTARRGSPEERWHETE